ncbi:MAG TPA: ACT domain-containing protein, partial [Bacteroidota bacterium]|nr:ACT domain-containing protein [Bacteroidota bacterium]
ADYFRERGIAGSVNADQIRLSLKRELQPYLEVSEKMGLLMTQLKSGPVTRINLVLRGELHRDAREVIQSAFLVGFLSTMLADTVNLVNATIIAGERGISIQTTSDEGHARYPLEISAECYSGVLKKTVTGTVFGNDDVRIIGIDDYHFDMKPRGHHLVYYNIDRPGMLAKVSTILARRSINIADLSLGRLKAGERALTVIATDQQVPAGVRDEISRIDGISEVSSVVL